MADRTGVRRWVRRAVVGAVLAAGVAVAQPPAPPKAVPPVVPAAAYDGGKPVAVITTAGGTVTITQEEFGKFLTDRGGADKIDLYVNKRLIEIAAAERKIEVSKVEMELALKQDMEGISVNHNDFVKIVLPRYGKTLYEWMEDIVRPRLLLAKMCAKDKSVVVTEDDLKIQYERVYGEKRRVQMILWPLSDDGNSVQKKWDAARKSQEDYDAAARAQPNPSLAIGKGDVAPIGRHTQSEDKSIEETAFKLKKDEVSELLKTKEGYVVLKLREIIPATTATTFEKEKDRLFAAAYDEKLQQEIPKKFAELKKAADPKTMYTPPKEWQALTPSGGLGAIVNPGSGGLPPAGK